MSKPISGALLAVFLVLALSCAPSSQDTPNRIQLLDVAGKDLWKPYEYYWSLSMGPCTRSSDTECISYGNSNHCNNCGNGPYAKCTVLADCPDLDSFINKIDTIKSTDKHGRTTVVSSAKFCSPAYAIHTHDVCFLLK